MVGLNLESLEYHDSIKITASGFIHLRVLCERIEYLYGVLPVTPIFNKTTVARIADYIDRENRHDRIAAGQKVDCIKLFLEYLRRQHESLADIYPGFGEVNSGSWYVIGQIEGTVDHFKRPSASYRRVNPLDA